MGTYTLETNTLDWVIIIVMVIGLLGVSAYGKKYMRSVADFLAADRLAGRYLLTVSSGFYGAISLVAMWEMTFSTGLPPNWWGMMSAPVGLFLGLTGFIVYRFRQTRALTLAQFFEERYSRSFRYYAGFLCWVSGVLNYGIFPLITANLFVYFLRLPETLLVLGYTIPTYWVVMLVYLSIAVYIACSGGQITIMLTDFLQGALLMLIFVIVIVFLLWRFEWADIIAGLQVVPNPEKESLINPFVGSTTDEFSIWFFLIALFSVIYNARSWQGNSGYNAAAKTPHEAVIAGVIGSWRQMVSSMCILLIPLIAYAVFHLEIFADMAAPINGALEQISDPVVRSQMAVPLFLKYVLPGGLAGLFAAVILGSAISCDDTYVHAWGTILIQDVIIPLRNKPLKPKTHMLVLRLSIIGVALFGFLFSIFFPMKGFIMMFFALTGAIYLGGAGAVIIGGLYWKRGSTAAAWTALTVGTVLGFGGVVMQQSWPYYVQAVMNPDYTTPITWTLVLGSLLGLLFVAVAAVIWNCKRLKTPTLITGITGLLIIFVTVAFWLGWNSFAAMLRESTWAMAYLEEYVDKFPVNGQVIYFWAMIAASACYFLVSLLGPRTDFNMDKLLHRGKYAVADDTVKGDEESVVLTRTFSFSKLIGITPEFSRFERFIFYGTFVWSMGWWAVFLLGTIYCLVFPVGDGAWSVYWQLYIWLSAGLGIVCTIWIFSGGCRDAVRLFKDLGKQRVSADDDGFVRDKDAE